MDMRRSKIHEPIVEMGRLFIIVVSIMVFMCLLSVSSFTLARENGIGLKFKGQKLSANLKEIPIKDIADRFEKEKGIWFQCDESLIEKRVSVGFSDLSLEDGLKRLLASLNYCLMFDKGKKLMGVIILGPSEHTPRNQVKGEIFSGNRILSQNQIKDTSDDIETFKIQRNSPPPRDPHAKSEVVPNDIETFKIQRDSPPPPDPDAKSEVVPNDIETFKIQRNSPPPQNPDAKPLDMTVIKNRPPPENLNAKPINTKIMKNCPPPGDK